MADCWAVAFEAQGEEEGRYILARRKEGDIAVFDSKRAAQSWVYWTSARSGEARPAEEVVYIKIRDRR